MKPITQRPSTPAIGTTVAAFATVLLGGLLLAGCGSSKGAAPPSTTTTTAAATSTTTTSGTSAAASFQAYQSCLQSHGVTLPQGGFRGGNRGANGSGNGGANTAGNGGAGAPPNGRPSFSAAQQKAINACASLQPAGGFGGGANTNNPASVKFQNCLKQHGVDPTDSNARASSAFQTALNACRSLLPNQGADAGGGFGNGAPPGGAGTPGGQGNSAAFSQLQTCLRNHGVNPGANGSGSQAKTQAAISACQKLLQGGGAGTSTTTTTG